MMRDNGLGETRETLDVDAGFGKQRLHLSLAEEMPVHFPALQRSHSALGFVGEPVGKGRQEMLADGKSGVRGLDEVLSSNPSNLPREQNRIIDVFDHRIGEHDIERLVSEREHPAIKGNEREASRLDSGSVVVADLRDGDAHGDVPDQPSGQPPIASPEVKQGATGLGTDQPDEQLGSGLLKRLAQSGNDQHDNDTAPLRGRFQ